MITGANGFVGPHVGAALQQRFGDQILIKATSRMGGNSPVLGLVETLDITDSNSVVEAVAQFQPTHVIHLAGLAAIHAVLANISAAWQVHLFGTLNVANAILGHAPECVLIFVGSGQVYGASARSGLPLDETALLSPTNGYEVTKAAADLALGALVPEGLRCIRMRPFNHTGVGQTVDFVVPNFATQIARIEAGREPAVIHVGDLSAERDFLDVRDVAAAYVLAVARSDEIPPGAIFNIASGIPRRIHDVLHQLTALSTANITLMPDPLRMRPGETPRFVGNAGLARRLLGWAPKCPFDDTIAEVLDHSRQCVKNGVY
jgi:GDP-4-dehydro-6-deoxy-D-mannose reductase